MNDNDLTLIIDLVAGRLSPMEERVAVERISTDPELRSAYDTQRAIASRLNATETPTMTPTEREHLHASLKTHLHLDAPVPISTRAPSRWNRWLAPIGGFAVAAVIIGAVVILPNTFSGRDSGPALEVAGAPTTTVAVDTTAPEPAATPESVAVAPATTPNTTGAAALSGQADDAADATTMTPLSIPYVPGLSLDQLAAAYASDPGLLDDLANRSSGERSDAEQNAGASCLASVTADLSGSTILPVVVTSVDGVDVLVIAVTPPDGAAYLATYSVSTCEPVSDTRG
jgi:hypothetical protein